MCFHYALSAAAPAAAALGAHSNGLLLDCNRAECKSESCSLGHQTHTHTHTNRASAAAAASLTLTGSKLIGAGNLQSQTRP